MIKKIPLHTQLDLLSKQMSLFNKKKYFNVEPHLISKNIWKFKDVLEKIFQVEPDPIVIKILELNIQLLTRTTINERTFQEIERKKLKEQKVVDFMEMVASSIKNPIIKANYAHFLWFVAKEGQLLQKQKKFYFSKMARDMYFQSSFIFETLAKKKKEKLIGRFISEYLIHSRFFDSQSGAKKTQVIEKRIFKIITDFPFDTNSHREIFQSLCNFLIKERKKIKINTDFKKINDLCIAFNQRYITQGEYFKANEICQIGIKLTTISQSHGIDWTILMANNYESKGEYLEAAYIFKDKNKEDYERNLLKHQEKINEKKEIVVEEVEETEEEKELKREIEQEQLKQEQEIKKYLDDKSEEIYKFFDIKAILELFGANLISVRYNRDKEDLYKLNFLSRNLALYEKELREQEVSLLNLLEKGVSDFKGNVVKIFDDKEELDFNFCRIYKKNIALFLYVFDTVLNKAIKDKKIDSDFILKLFENCWFGKNISIPIRNGEKFEHTFLDLIKPNLDLYFKLKETKQKNYSMIIDSLALRFEGLFREMLRQLNKPTFTVLKDSNGKTFVTELDINGLLKDKNINDFLTEDDLLFYRFILIEKGGYNLRHDISHSLKLGRMYREEHADLLVIGLLKLMKYNL